jgi:hypothetical protein
MRFLVPRSPSRSGSPEPRVISQQPPELCQQDHVHSTNPLSTIELSHPASRWPFVAWLPRSALRSTPTSVYMKNSFGRLLLDRGRSPPQLKDSIPLSADSPYRGMSAQIWMWDLG